MRASFVSCRFGTVLLIGLLYAVIGVVFALPSSRVQIWRLAAWLISAVLYAGHIGYESFRLRNAARFTALHVSSAVAIGGFALAVAATVHSFFVAPNYHRSRFMVALVVWPLLTGIPAFFVALAAAAVMNAFRRNSFAE